MRTSCVLRAAEQALEACEVDPTLAFLQLPIAEPDHWKMHLATLAMLQRGLAEVAKSRGDLVAWLDGLAEARSTEAMIVRIVRDDPPVSAFAGWMW